MDDPQQVTAAGLGEIAAAASPDPPEQVRLKDLGGQGLGTGLMRGLGALAAEERREAGARLNALKDTIGDAIGARAAELDRAALANRLAAERADATLPVSPPPMGRIHPISQTIDEIIAIFGEMGFVVAEGPHIEEDFYNFTALNIPPEHPARQEHDTFYLPPRPGHISNTGTAPGAADEGSRLVLRTHTSPVQVRTMLKQ